MDKISLQKIYEEIKILHPEYEETQILSCLAQYDNNISLSDLEQLSVMAKDSAYSDADLGLAVEKQDNDVKLQNNELKANKEEDNTLRNAAFGVGGLILLGGTALFARSLFPKVKNLFLKSKNVKNTYVPTQLKEYIDKGTIHKNFANKILNDTTLDVKTKQHIFRYIENKTSQGTDKLTRYVLQRQGIKTVNKIINNPDIDRRVVGSIVENPGREKILENYKLLSKYQLDPLVSYSLASTKQLPQNIEECGDFCKRMLGFTEPTVENSQGLANIFNYYKNINISELNQYVKSIDKEKLLKLEPKLKEYNSNQMVNFLNFHKERGVQNFTKENLTLNENLTTFLENNPMGDSQGIEELLTAFPLTNTRIGKTPNFWNLSENESTQIFNATENFAKNCELWRIKATLPELESKAIKDFETSLKDILKQDVSIEAIGSGSYGKVYKISTQNSRPVVIKLFYKDKGDLKNGAMAEIPMGPFVNKHFPGRFSEFYYGKIPSSKEENGFMVTEFLTKSAPGELPKIKDTKYSYMYNDGNGFNHSRGNIIGGKISDYGCLDIIESGSENVRFRLF